MEPGTWNLLRRCLRSLFVFALVWAGFIAATGGFQFRIGTLRVSSRELDNPLILAFAAAVALIVVARLDGRDGLAREWASWRRAADALVGWAGSHRDNIAAAAPAILALFVIGLQVRRWIGAEPLWLDEEGLVLSAREHSFAQLAGPAWIATTAPLGWLVTERAVILALGTGEVVLRLLPMLFGIGTLLVAVWIGRRWMTPFAATVLVLLCAVNRWLSMYWFETKQYSADAFWGIALPAMAAWVIDADDDVRRIRRAAAWWGAAMLGQWFGNGAALVAPGCALVIVGASWRPRRAATWAIPALGLIWVAGCLLHYQLAMRYTLNSAYFYQYWSSRFPPTSLGLIGTLRWLYAHLAELGDAPGGTSLWISLWMLALCGFAFGSNRILGLVFATVPLTAFLLAVLRIVPLFQRFVLWMAPALAVGIALILDRAVRAGAEGARRRDPLPIAVAVGVAFVVVRLSADVVVFGQETFRIRTDSKHGLDDRAAVRWLMERRQPGDAIMTTHLGWPAVWWYGDIPIGDNDVAQGRLRDGGVMLEVGPEDQFPGCTDTQLRDALKGYRRVLVYIGFPDFPKGFPEALLHRLEELGTPAAHGSFAELGQAEIVDLNASAARGSAAGSSSDRSSDHGRYPGCIGARTAVAR